MTIAIEPEYSIECLPVLTRKKRRKETEEAPSEKKIDWKKHCLLTRNWNK